MLFLLWLLFARAPCHWFLECFLLSSPGVQSGFFVAPRWAPRPFGGARCFFFGSGPGERQGKEKPRWAPARGQRKKKNWPGGGRSKKKKTPLPVLRGSWDLVSRL